MNADFAIGLGMFFLRAGLLLACFWIVYGLLRSNPRARVMLCRIVSVAVVLLPILNFVPMPAILNLPAFHQPRIEQAPPTPHEFTPPEPVVRNEAPPTVIAHDSLPLVIEPSPVSHTPTRPVAPAPVHAWKLPPLPAPGTLAAVWLAAVCFFLSRRGVAILMARRLATAAQTPPDWVLQEGRNLCARLGICGKVTFGVAGKICSPLLLGPAPVILLPSHLVSEDSTADACAALAHELVHVRQKDWHWSQWLHCVAVVTWPLPLAWFLRRAHDAAGELVCDHLAAESAGGAESYAGSLARQSLHAIGHPLPATMPMLRKSGIRRRIDLLLSGVKLPSPSWRVTLGAVLLTLLAGGLLGGLQLARAAGNPAKNESPVAKNTDIKKEFETLAGETSYLDMDDAFFRRTGYTPALSEKNWDRYTAFMPRLIAVHAGKDDLIPLLKHKDPKVRTLAIAALASLDDPTVLPFIADLLGDDAVTFWRNGPDGSDSSPPPIRKDVTVGEDAQQILALYLFEAGYGRYDDKRENLPKEFDDYWSTHKGRAWCASWFAVRLDGTQDLKADQYDRAMHLIRADLDKVPLQERFWVALWLGNKPKPKPITGPDYKLPYPLYSHEELVDMGRKIGPEALMTVLKEQRYPGDDPDLLHGNYYNTKFIGTGVFVLKNAAALLRPQDSDVLLTLNTGKSISPLWPIAAANVEPEKAVEILHAAYARFMGDSMVYDRSALSIALWQLGGESQTSFLTDQFYYDAERLTQPLYSFVDGIASIEKPPGRKLIAAVLQDKRLDKVNLDEETFLSFKRAVNRWAGKTVVTDTEIAATRKGEGNGWKPTNPDNFPLRKELLHNMRDSAPQWVNAADEAPKPENSPAQNADVKAQFEKLAAETSYFDFGDAYYRRTSTPYDGDGPDYRAFIARTGYHEALAHFYSIHAGKNELIPLLKHGDPKVRTLAIAALASLNDPAVLPFIADLLSDDAITFSKAGDLNSNGAQIGQTVRLRTDVTVGENAREALSPYLGYAGYSGITRETFDDYWSKHKGREYCASWFAVRLYRAWFTSDFLEEKSRILADLKKVPQPDRIWISVWLKYTCGYTHTFRGTLHSDEELVEMCRNLGPDALMTALKEQRAPSDDPDLPYGTADGIGVNRHFEPTARFILQNAAALLRPEDSSALLALSTGNNRGPWWIIAAAHLQPAKAVELLRGAYPEFTNNWDRIKLCVALWQLGGESQTPFLVDQFYDNETATANQYQSSKKAPGCEFINAFGRIEKPSGAKLIASILQDKRSTNFKTDGWSVAALAEFINGWIKNPIASTSEISEARSETEVMGGIVPGRSANLVGELLQRERDSIPVWINAGAAAVETPQRENNTAQNADIKTQFETLAGESSYFEINDVIYKVNKRLDFHDAFSAHDPKYPAFLLKLLSIPAGKDDLIALLKHKDPKVRTLAIAALVSRDDPTVLPYIADLLSDDAITFSRELLGQNATPPPLRSDVTVAENAREVLFLYLYKAGYKTPAQGLTLKDFDAYWSDHKGRNYCASWFAVRLERAIYCGPEGFAEASDLVRTDLEKIPEPQRTWTALWVNAGVYGGYDLYSKEALLKMCAKLGPEALMKAIKQREFPGDDPDLRYGNDGWGNYSFVSRANFILQNAATLLRPEDSATIASLGDGENPSPQWFIAAAQLNPAKAVEILRAAYARFPGNMNDHESERMTLDLALWQLGGESQIPFLVDRFYADALDPASRYKWGGPFIMTIGTIEKPPGRKLIAAILQDKRLDDLKVGKMHFYFIVMARAINGWARKPVISDADITTVRSLRSERVVTNIEAPGDDLVKMKLLHLMRDSAPEWSN